MTKKSKPTAKEKSPPKKCEDESEELYQMDSDSDSPVPTPVSTPLANKKKETKSKKKLSPKTSPAKTEKSGSPVAVKKEENIETATIEEVKPIVKDEKPATLSKSTGNFFGGKKAEKSDSNSIKVSSVSSGSAGKTYSPNKENYHPIDDACWAKGEPVPYSMLAQTLYCMEKTSKRLELLSIITNYFRSVLALSPKDLIPSMYILTNKVAPDYDTLELGIGDTVLFKALAEATGCTLAKLKTEFQSKGDIGLVAEANRCNQKLIFAPKKLSVNAVFTKFKEIAAISGNSSQSKKCDLIRGLLVSCDAIEARYLMRSLAGKLRNGLGELSILTALAHACIITPPQTDPEKPIVIDSLKKLRVNDLDEMKKQLTTGVERVKNAYHQCPNYERVVNAIINHGLENLQEHCKIIPGVPLKPMLANPTKGIHEVLKRFDDSEFTCEYKYDGERAQVIKEK